MQVVMLVGLSGTRNGVDWPPRGSVVDLPKHEALDMIAGNLAREVSSDDRKGRPEPAARQDSDSTPGADGDPQAGPDSGPAPATEPRPAAKRRRK